MAGPDEHYAGYPVITTPSPDDYVRILDISDLNDGVKGSEVHIKVEDLVLPKGDIRLYGAKVDGVTDDSAAFRAAVEAHKGTGTPVTLPEGTMYMGMTDDTYQVTEAILMDGDIKIEGAGRGKSILKFGPDDATFTIWGLLIRGCNAELRDFSIRPPTLTTVATTDFDDLRDIYNWNAVWIDPDDVNVNILIERVDVDVKGFRKSFQMSGSAANGCKWVIRDCEVQAYGVCVGMANTDDTVANNVSRELWLHDCKLIGHNNEGNATWNQRGRCTYVHPTVSCDYNNVDMYGMGRVQCAQYSSGHVPWNAHPPKYLNFNNIHLHQIEGGPYTEGFQTGNLVGCTSLYTNCTIDVQGQTRVRNNTIFQGCTIKGISKEFTSQDGPLKTYMAVAGSATDTSITVKDASAFSDTDDIKIWLDDNTLHETTVSGAPVGNVITLADALPSGVAINRWVVWDDIPGGPNGDTVEWVRWDACSFENDPYPGAMINGKTRITHYVNGSTVEIGTLQGGNTDFYHSDSANAGTLFSSNNAYRYIGNSTGFTAEFEHADAVAHFSGDTWEGDALSNTMIIPTASSITFDNCISYLNSDTGTFMNGAAAANTVSGSNNRWLGTALPRMTNTQALRHGAGMNPSSVASAATLDLDPSYDMHRVTGTTAATDILFGGLAAIDQNFSGEVTIIAVDGFVVTDGARLEAGGGNITLNAGEACRLIFSSEDDIVYCRKV